MAARKTRRDPADQTLPEPGAAFLMPLADGRFGVCRVIRRQLSEAKERSGSTAVLAAATPWIGRQPPALSDPLLRLMLVLNHHNWGNELEVQWVSGPPPMSLTVRTSPVS